MLPKQVGELFSDGVRTRGVWDSTEKLQHINVLKLKAVGESNVCISPIFFDKMNIKKGTERSKEIMVIALK